MTERAAIELTGLVQGVGFRPFVHALATALDLRGFVQNRGAHVLVDVEGPSGTVACFVERLVREPPPSALIDSVRREALRPAQWQQFVILASEPAADSQRHVPPDVATCDDCLRELFDPANRRYRHAFVNCSHCGPRYSMIARLPFDRAATSMAAFPMCAECASEYADSADRRFHAQGICCRACGPRLFARDDSSVLATDDEALRLAETVLDGGGVVAVKGIGGFHLACDATNGAAVAELRRRKRRERKPFAVMLPWAERRAFAASQSAGTITTMLGSSRPIVIVDRALVRRAARWALARDVAPGVPGIGVFLPYSPLHHLLLADLNRPLVMTSGNGRDEPMACDDEQAFADLAPIADLFLTHDRAIRHRCDDSVTRTAAGRLIPIRRGRGEAPVPLPLSETSPRTVLAAGADLKNTFCLVHGSTAYVSAHVGNLGSAAACQSMSISVAQMSALLGLEPELIVHDRHPDFLATRIADCFPSAERLAVQHHHAHVLSCVAENRCTEPVIGVAFDGAGLGDDGAMWGGEFLIVEDERMERAAHLAYVALPGGDAAAREPWRMALSHLAAAGVPPSAACRAAIAGRIGTTRANLVSQLINRGTCSPPTSSIGRLFDAVAALVGLGDVADFEGQAAMALEAVATEAGALRYACDLQTATMPWTIDAAPMIRAIVADVAAGRPTGQIAAAFHGALADAVVLTAQRLSALTGIRTVALTGGVFQNARLTEATASGLVGADLQVLEHRHVPCNDGGLSLGQALFGLRVLRARAAVNGTPLCA